MPKPVRNRRPQGFSTSPLRPLWHLALPGIQGRERRQLFNTVSALGAVGAGLLVGCVALTLLGPVAGVLGLLIGLQVTGQYVVERRFFRP